VKKKKKITKKKKFDYKNFDWAKEIDASLIILNKNSNIVKMNDKAQRIFDAKKNKLIGKKAFGCHPAFALPRLKKLLKSGKTDVYTTQTRKSKTLVFHTPVHKDGKYIGYAELEIPIRKDMRNLIRGDFGLKEY
jgi:DUF438 domain-containing protein